MNTGQGFCILLLFTNAVEAMLSQQLIPKMLHELPEAMKGESQFDEGMDAEQLVENLKYAHAKPLESDQANKFLPVDPVTDARDCPIIAPRRRSLILVRRGCIGGLGKGLSSTAAWLSKSGAQLQRFDKFFSALTFRQRLLWFARKGYNGAAHTVKLGAKGVKFLARILRYGAVKTLRGTWRAVQVIGSVAKKTAIFGGKVIAGLVLASIVTVVEILRHTWKLAKIIGYIIPLHSWKYLGKGLAATGRGFQKAGNRMQVQSTAQLSKGGK